MSRETQSPVQTEKESSLFCTRCGTKNKPEAVFCMNCGAPLVRAQKQPVKKKSVPKIAIILPVCVVVLVIGIVAFLALGRQDDASPESTPSAPATPFTEYLALVGGDYKALYSDEYNVVQSGVEGQYMALTDISFMDIDGKGSFDFYHMEDEDSQAALEKSGIENDTVLRFRWACDASVHNLEDVSASFQSIYGDSPMHGTYSLDSDGARQVESYCWENVEGGYDLELSLESNATAINASWSVSPDVEGSYKDVLSTLENALKEKDASAYESLLYKNGVDPSASDSTAEELADILSSEAADRIDCKVGEVIKVNAYLNQYLALHNYYQTFGQMGPIESLYIADADLTLYQNDNIITGASCKIDIAYVDSEWKILGLFRNDRFSDTLLVEFAKQYYEAASGNIPPQVEIDHYEGENAVIHLYEINGNATSTWDWYTINPYTLEGTDFLGNEIRLYDAFDGEGQ